MRLEKILPRLGDMQKVVLVDDATCVELYDSVYDGKSISPILDACTVEQIIGNSEGVRIYISAPKRTYRRKGE